MVKKKKPKSCVECWLLRFSVSLPFQKGSILKPKSLPDHHHHRNKISNTHFNSLFFTTSNTQIQNPSIFKTQKFGAKIQNPFLKSPQNPFPIFTFLKQTNKHRFVWKIWILYFHGNPKTQLCSFGFHHSRRNLWRVFTIERNSWRVFSIFAFWNPRWPFFGPYTLNSKWVFSIWPIYGCSAVKLNWVFLNFTSHQWNPKWVFFFFFGYGNRNPRWLSQLPSLVWWRRRCSWGRRRAITLFPKSLIG